MAEEKPYALWAGKILRSDAVFVRTRLAATYPWRRRVCLGIALAKTGRPYEKSLLGNVPSISQPVRACPVECEAYSSGVGLCEACRVEASCEAWSVANFNEIVLITIEKRRLYGN